MGVGSNGNSVGGARCWAGCFKLHITCMRSALFLSPSTSWNFDIYVCAGPGGLYGGRGYLTTTALL